MKAKRPSLRAAIDQHCKNCLYDPGRGNGAWREQIDRCTSTNCAIWPVRPRSNGERIKAVSSRKDAPEQHDANAGAETDVSALLGAAFPHNEAASG